MALTFFSARYSGILKTSLFCCMTTTPLWIILGLPTEIMALWWFTCWTQVSEIHIQALTVWFLTVIYFKFCHSGVEMETRNCLGNLKISTWVPCDGLILYPVSAIGIRILYFLLLKPGWALNQQLCKTKTHHCYKFHALSNKKKVLINWLAILVDY